MTRTAAVLVIGNEILTGKIREGNAGHLAETLFGLGIALRRVVVCADEIDVIATDLRQLSGSHDLVFSSGGVGPTHDDVTLAAVAKALDVPLDRSPVIEQRIRSYFKERCTPAHLRMADIPRGSVLLDGAGVPWPVIVAGKVHILPGLPEAFRLTLRVLEERLAGDAPFVSRALYISSEEGDVAALLATAANNHPKVSIGSYPRWNRPDHKVKLTFDGKDRDAVERALAEVRAGIPAPRVVREK